MIKVFKSCSTTANKCCIKNDMANNYRMKPNVNCNKVKKDNKEIAITISGIIIGIKAVASIYLFDFLNSIPISSKVPNNPAIIVEKKATIIVFNNALKIF